VDVGAVGDRIGLAEPRQEGLGKRNAHDEVAGERVTHFLRLRPPRVRQHRVGEADALERAENVGAELDAGTEFAEFGGLLQDADRKTLARKRIGCGKPTDAAPGDQDRQSVRFRHRSLPRHRSALFIDGQPARCFDFFQCNASVHATPRLSAPRRACHRLPKGRATMTTKFNVNGKAVSTEAPPQTPLLWVIREGLKLTGTKYGCGTGLCGACMVHIDGKRAFSCQTQVSEVAERSVTTIEGLSPNASHRLQKAWLAENVPQCGYCQSGQIMSAADLLNRVPNPTRDEIVEHMSTNICRCGTYQRIVRAVERAVREV
jgi:isoquinoline 1-oxidoreductase alpha subunit